MLKILKKSLSKAGTYLAISVLWTTLKTSIDKMTVTRKQKYGLIFLLILITSFLFFYFIKPHSFGNPEVELYFADRFSTAHKVLIDLYNKKNKGKVRVVPIDFPNMDFSTNERKEVLARSLRSRGDGIDLFAVDVIWVQRFAKWCEPLDPYFSREEKSRLLDHAMKSCYYEGELVAVPLDLVQGVMYYREDLVRKLPEGEKLIDKINNGITWNEFIKLGEKVKANHPFYIFPAADFEGFICCYMDLLLSQKPDYFDKYGFYFQTPEAEKALQLLVDLVNKYNLTPATVTGFTEVLSYAYFIKNDGLFLRGWQTYDKDFKESPYDKNKEDSLSKAPIPYFEGSRPGSVFGGWDLMVSKFSDKKKEAVDFVKFLLSNEAQELFYTESGFYPVVNKFYNDPGYLKKYPQITRIKSLLDTGVHRPAHEEYTRFSKIMSFYFEKAMKKQITVKEALARVSSTIQSDKEVIKGFSLN